MEYILVTLAEKSERFYTEIMHFKESIFLSSVRTLCKAFAAILGITVGIGVILIIFSLSSRTNILPPEKLDITLAPDAEGNRNLLPESTPVILRIDFHGTIGEKNLTADCIERILYASREDFLEGRVKAILLHMDTPGGVANDDDGINRLLEDYKKKYNIPIYAFVDGMCASGGMYVAVAADKIYATAESIIGSIGVIMGPTFNFSEVMTKVGVQSLTLTQGKDKDMLNPYRPWKPDEDASLQPIMEQLYRRFVDLMVSSRPQINREKLVNEYGANVYSAADAVTIGYIDQADSSYAEALTALIKAAGISGKVQVVSLNIPSTFVSALFNNKYDLLSGKITHVFQLGSNLSTEMSGKFLHLYVPGYATR